MANKFNLLKIGLIAISLVVALAGCGEKEPEAKIEPGATSPSVGAAISSRGAGTPGAPPAEAPADPGAPSTKGAPRSTAQGRK